MVKRAFLLLLGASTFSGIIQAATLTPEQALQRVHSLSAPSMRAVAGKDVKRVPAFTSYIADEPASYVFTGSEGWMILSADDNAPAILGYSDTGVFDPENIPDNMRAWLDSYAEQIKWMRENPSNFTPLAVTDGDVTESRTEIAPMLTTKWNQDSPFNDKTPRFDGVPTMTGCVATAMAQVMNYHKWPAVGTGTHTYTMKVDGVTRTIDFAEHPFDWANMADTYNANSPAAQKEAVADLMSTCGLAISSEYDTQATGALTSNLAMALMKYFDYNKSIGWAQRQYYKVDEWDELIYSQLKNYGPVLYGGVTSGGAGHQFVCDGYRTDGYFHINWGWGGLSDGYYLLSVMAPAMQGIGGSYAGYNFNQDAIINIRPAKADDEVNPWVCVGMINQFSVNQTAPKIGNYFSTATRSTWFVNWGFEDLTMDIAFVVEGKTKWGNDTLFTFGGSKGSEVYRKDNVLKTYTAENRYPYFSSMITGYMPEMSDGQYVVYPGYRLSKIGETVIPEADRTWSKFSYCSSLISYYDMTVDNGAITIFKAQEIGIPLVPDFKFDTPLYLGRTTVVKAKITNNTNTEFYGDLAGFFFADTATGDKPGSTLYQAPANRLSIRPGETIDFEYAFQFNAQVNYTRDYKFAFVARPYTIDSSSSTYYIISDLKTVTSEIAPYGAVEATSSVGTDGNILCLPKDKLDFAIDVKCVDGTYYNTIDFWVYEYEEDEAEVPAETENTDDNLIAPASIEDGTGTWVRKFVTYSPYLRLAEGQTQTVNVHLNYDGEINKTYGLKAFSTWIAISDMIQFYLVDNTSAFDYDVTSTDAKPAAADAKPDGSIPEDKLNFTTNVTVNRGSFASSVDFLLYEKNGDNWELTSTVSSDKMELAEGEAADAAVTLELPVSDTVYGIRAYAGPFKLNEMREFTVVNKEISGVEDVVTESNAEVRYLNMQGIEVANPGRGEIVIRVTGNRAEKIVVR